MPSKIVLLSIDPQNDFCDPNGALSVSGADKDMERLASMVKKNKSKIDDIFVTLDSHRTVHVAHPIWWVNTDGEHPAPFTIINKDDVCGSNPQWRSYNPGYQKWSEYYVSKLAENNRYPLCVWPPHCLIGSWGHAIYPVLFEALCEWEHQYATVNYVTKGSNIRTEHYSAMQADVQDSDDNTTGLNTKLIEELQTADIIAISGEASSHCVKHTVMDIANNFGEENITKFVYLEDTSSPVPGFEAEAESFIKEMTDRGMKLAKAEDFLS